MRRISVLPKGSVVQKVVSENLSESFQMSGLEPFAGRTSENFTTGVGKISLRISFGVYGII